MEKELKKVLFITNIPAPYRIDFYNELGRYCNLTVIFEAKRATGITFNWKEDNISTFKAIFLSEGEILEKKVNWNIITQINKLDYDLLFITNYTYFTETIALMYLKLRRINYYYEVDGAIKKPNEGIVKKLFKTFFLSGAKAYFSPSKVSDEYFHYYTKSKALYRYPFTSLRECDLLKKPLTQSEKKQIRHQLLIKEEYVILAIGQFIHRKGFDVLMKAAKRLNKNIGIYIVGGVPTKEYLELQKELNLKQVHLEGFKTKNELAEYFKAADMFVLPTREDIWGLVINEAMAYGLPIITTNKCGAGLELLDDEQCIVNVDDVDGLYSAIKRIVDDKPLQEKLAFDNLNKIRNYTIEKMAQAHLEIINR